MLVLSRRIGEEIVIEAAGGIDGRILRIPHDLVVSPAHEKGVVEHADVRASKADRLELIVFVFERQPRHRVIASRQPKDVAWSGDRHLAGSLGADIDRRRRHAVNGLRTDVQAGPDSVAKDNVVAGLRSAQRPEKLGLIGNQHVRRVRGGNRHREQRQGEHEKPHFRHR